VHGAHCGRLLGCVLVFDIVHCMAWHQPNIQWLRGPAATPAPTHVPQHPPTVCTHSMFWFWICRLTGHVVACAGRYCDMGAKSRHLRVLAAGNCGAARKLSL